MLKVNFNLKSSKSTDSLLLCRISSSVGRIQLSTGEKVKVSMWNKDAQKLYERGEFKPQAIIFNSMLTKWKAEITLHYNKLRLQESLSRKSFEDGIRQIFSGNAASIELKTFFGYYPEYLEAFKNTAGYRSKNSTYKKLKSFKEVHGNFSWGDIDLEWLEIFKSWIMPFNYKQNYLWRLIANLKAYIRFARKKKIHDYDLIEDEKFKISKYDTDSIALNVKELLQLYNTKLSGTYDLCRDMFCIAAFTGVRFEDVDKINKSSIQDGLLVFTTGKTLSKAIVPLHWVVREILEKYEYVIPNPPANATVNEYIKIIAREAGIIEPTTITHIINGKPVTTVKDKCDLITFHTARRSMASNMNESGLPSAFGMKVLGHSKLATYEKYQKHRLTRLAEEYKNHEFFHKKSV